MIGRPKSVSIHWRQSTAETRIRNIIPNNRALKIDDEEPISIQLNGIKGTYSHVNNSAENSNSHSDPNNEIS